ncbi:MAG: TrkH family potassium uptake protein, partial [Clostridia bacterium]|nr:TrkH family potassium uptake protein [Clostridia bacterium]
NTIDQGGMSLPSKMISMALMFVGASPASTGGGIKTTTFCIIVLACWSVIKGDDDINFRFRKISVSLALKAFVIFAIGVLVVLISSSLLMVFERGTGLLFEAALFEAFSAFGTVGLTVGITPQLCTASRIVLIVTMYAGRVGPLTLTMALVGAKGKKRLVRRMETNMMIG